MASVTAGSPFVSVPVLSKATAVILCAFSKASPPFIKMPDSTPFVVPTMSAVGVASPSAHGHETTSTATAKSSDAAKLRPKIKYQSEKVTRSEEHTSELQS